MGNIRSTKQSALQQRWSDDNIQTFMIKAHKNKLFGCDVIVPNKLNNNEIWVASCSADGKLFIHEVLIETEQQKHERQKILNAQSHSSLTKSKSLSSVQNRSQSNKKNNKKKSARKKQGNIKPFQITTTRLCTIYLDSTFCYTLSLHPSCRYVSTCIDKSLFIYEVDFNSEAPIFNEVKLAKKYISGAMFIDDKHIIFCSGDGCVYIYNFIIKKLVSKIEHNNDILCFDHTILSLNKYNIYEKKNIITFATMDGTIFVYDISNIIEKDFEAFHDLDDKKDNNELQIISKQDKYDEEESKVSAIPSIASNKFGHDAVYQYQLTTKQKHTKTQCADNEDKQKPKENKKEFEYKPILLQQMFGQFGADISCIKMSENGQFIVIGSDDNTYNIYYLSVLKGVNDDDNNNLDIKWILLCKQIVVNDANINHVAWINSTTVIASCDKGKELYLSGIYDITDSQIVLKLLMDIVKFYAEDIGKLYDNKSNELQSIIEYIMDIILQYVMWYILHSEMNVDFDEHISCIATCPNVNNGAGIIVVGGFSKLLQCFLPLQ